MQQNDKMTELFKKKSIMSLISSGLALISLYIPIFSAFGGSYSMNLFNYLQKIFLGFASFDLDFWDFGFASFTITILLFNIIETVKAIKALIDPDKMVKPNIKSHATDNLTVSTMLFVFCLIYIFADGGVGGALFFIFGGTFSWLFPLLHIVPFYYERKYCKEYNNKKTGIQSKEREECEARLKNANATASNDEKKATQTTVQTSPNPRSNNGGKIAQQKEQIELLKEYKTLLDSGIITNEEFNKKKNELLNVKSDDISISSQPEEDSVFSDIANESDIPGDQTNDEKYYDVIFSISYEGLNKTEAERKKFRALKEIRESANITYEQAMYIVENAPALCLEAATYDEANELKEKLEALGITIVLEEHKP